MSSFGSRDITQIVDRLIGRVNWVGDTPSDEDHLENLGEVEYLLDHLLVQVRGNVEAMKQHPDNYSAKKLGNASKDILLQIKSDLVSLGL